MKTLLTLKKALQFEKTLKYTLNYDDCEQLAPPLFYEINNIEQSTIYKMSGKSLKELHNESIDATIEELKKLKL